MQPFDAGSPGPAAFSGETRVANAMEKKIREKQWQPGTRIPGAHEIARVFGGAGLSTVRKALTQLEAKGLLRKEGKVYFVAEEAAPLSRPEPAGAEKEVRRFLGSKRLTVQNVATILDLSKMTVYRLVQAGELEAYRFGRDFRIPDYALAEYIARSRFRPGDPIDLDELAGKED